DPSPGRFVLPQSVGLVIEGAADVAGLERGLTQHPLGQVGEVGRVPSAVPQVVFSPTPELGGQEAAVVACDLAEVTQMVPLGGDQVGLERAAVLDEHFVERALDRDL